MSRDHSNAPKENNGRFVYVGRDVIHSIIVTGDHNQFFVGEYEQLRDAYIKPWSVFERVNLKQFVGREWLAAKVDTFLQQQDRGYFILEAEAGLGKTAFMAWLVQQRGYIHHFSELVSGPDEVGHSLKSLAAQLALAYGLKPEGVLPSAATRPDYLVDLLRQATAQRRADERIVLVVDALDEASTPLNQNVLGLPSVLPEGVFVIASQRPVKVSLEIDVATTPRMPYHLSAEEPDNRADMERFLEQAAAWPGVANALKKNKYTAQQFKSTLLHKCRGVWIYLHFVVHEIEQGERSPLELEALPDGMPQYYTQHWRRWRDEDEAKWDEVYLPLLTTLAAAQESISLERLLEWSGVKFPKSRVRRLLAERWRPYLATESQGSHILYRFYHATLQEFFDGRLQRDKLTVADDAFIEELSDATRTRHHRLVDRYLETWGGWTKDLSGLRDEKLRDIDEGYGLRQLTTHMEKSARINDLHHLLQVEWERSMQSPYSWEKREKDKQSQHRIWAGIRYRRHNAWYTILESVGRIDGYLADINRAWQLAVNHVSEEMAREVSEQNAAAEEGWLGQYIGLQCRYALILASLNSQAHNIRPGFLVELIKKGIWLPIQAITYARQIPDLNQQVAMFIALVPFLPDKEKEEILQEALAIARKIEDNSVQLKQDILATLGPHLTPAQLQEALAVAGSIGDKLLQAYVLSGLVPYLTLEQLQEVQVRFRSLVDNPVAGHVLIDSEIRRAQPKLIRRLVELGNEQEALSVVRNIEHNSDQTEALIVLAPHLTPEQLSEALDVARSINNSHYQAYSLTAVASYCTPIEQKIVLQEAFAIVHTIRYSSGQADVLAILAPHLTEGQLHEALTVIRGIENGHDRAEALAALAPHLTPEQLSEALEAAQSIKDSYYQAKALAALAPHLTPAEREIVLQEVLTIIHSIEYISSQSDVLAIMASHLTSDQLNEALAIVHKIQGSPFQAETLTALAPHLTPEQLNEALAIVHDLESSNDRAKALTALAPHLTPEQLNEALAIAHDLGGSDDQAKALAALAPHLTPEQLSEALAIARSIQRGRDQTNALTALAPYLTSKQLREALIVANNIWLDYTPTEAVTNLASYFTPAQVPEALEFVDSIYSQDAKVDVLTALAPHLTPEQLQEALTVVRRIDDGTARSRTQGRLQASMASHLAEQGKTEEALEMANRIDKYWRNLREEARTGLVPHLAAHGKIEEALMIARGAERDSLKAEALAALAPYLTSYQLGRAQQSASRMSETKYRNATQAKLRARQLSCLVEQGQIEEALWKVRRIEDGSEQADALIALASHLTSDQVDEALWIARDMEYKYKGMYYSDYAIAKLAPFLTPEQVAEECNRARSFEDADNRARAMAKLAPFLTSEQVAETLVLVRSIKNSWYRERALAALVPRLAELGKVEEALSVVRSFYRGYDEKALTYLASRLAELGQIDGALEIIKMIDYDKSRFETLAHLATRLTKLGHIDGALVMAKNIPIYLEHERTLADVALGMAEWGQKEEALSVARSLQYTYMQARTLSRLAPKLLPKEQEEVLLEALTLARSFADLLPRGEPLANLAPQLAKLPRNVLVALWHETLPILSSRTRTHLATDLALLADVIVRLGGESAIAETIQSFEDVGQWWP